MPTPRRDTRGIVEPAALMRQVSFRRVAPAPALAPFVEHYWFIDWDLATPFEQHVVGHPSVNIVITQATADDPVTASIAGVGRGLFSIKLTGHGWVRAAQFRPGGFRPFHDGPVSSLTDRQVPLPSVPALDDSDDGAAAAGDGAAASGDGAAAAGDGAAASALGALEDGAAASALDRFLLGYEPHLDEASARAIALVDELRHDRTLTRVDRFADHAGLSIRALQRLFLDCVGVPPKWVILRYRVQEAIERAGPDVDWAALAAELGYSDQAHLVRDFTATIGQSPTAYAR